MSLCAGERALNLGPAEYRPAAEIQIPRRSKIHGPPMGALQVLDHPIIASIHRLQTQAYARVLFSSQLGEPYGDRRRASLPSIEGVSCLGQHKGRMGYWFSGNPLSQDRALDQPKEPDRR